MSKKNLQNGIIAGTVVGISAGAANAESGLRAIAVKDLHTHGINRELVTTLFLQKQGIDLNLNEILQVELDEEGKNLKLETMDHLSVSVDLFSARGVGNKDLMGH